MQNAESSVVLGFARDNAWSEEGTPYPVIAGCGNSWASGNYADKVCSPMTQEPVYIDLVALNRIYINHKSNST